MAPSDARGRLARAVVRAAAALVPGETRVSWRRQWLADLHHHRDWLAGRGVSRTSLERDLARRAAGSFRHAAWLRWRRWRTHMITQDLRYAVRSLARRPGFSAVIVLTLALGIGANATIFSWIDALVFNPLPGAADASSLVALHFTTATRDNLSFSYPNYVDVRDAQIPGLDGMLAFRTLALGVRQGSGEPGRTWAEIVSGNYFQVLGVQAELGRLLSPHDDTSEGTGAVAVLSDRLWQARFGSRSDIVGAVFTVNGQPLTIVGVAGPGFKGATNGLAVDLWVPMIMQPRVHPAGSLTDRGDGWLSVIARLSPGASPARMQAGLSAKARRLAEAYPGTALRGIRASSLADEGAGHVLVPVMTVVMAVVGIVLLIACANIAGLMLARGAARRREVAVRLAVGASRWQLVRQLLTESLVLACAGGLAGLAVAGASRDLLAALLPAVPYPVLIPAGLSPRVLLVTSAAVAASTLIFGLLPALQASRPGLVPALREETGMTGGRQRTLFRRVLVAGQVALALLLLIGAGLFARTSLNAQHIDPGFRERSALLASIDLTAAGYDTTTGRQFYRDLLSRLESMPGVRAASLTSRVPLSIGSESDTSPRIEGYTPAKNEDVTVYFSMVAPHYFDSLRLPIVEGRAIDARDTIGAPLVVVINQTMARRYWHGRDPVGGRLDYDSGWATVVGVAKDGRYGSISESPKNVMYLPIDQAYRPTPTLVVATTTAPASVVPEIRRAVSALNPDLPLFEVETLADHLDASVFLPRLASMLLGAFGALALLLAVIGLYGVIAYSVAMRTREIGVRMALGAARSAIRRQVLVQGIRLGVVGLVIGLALAAAATPLLASQLVGVRPFDAGVFASTSAVLLVVAGLAAWAPAWRASRIDPIRALREE
jgi:putative ABC transport system permease protein